MMKKFFVILTALFVSLISATAFAEPTCIMMKFANDTRYQNIDSASALSDLVLEKLLASGKFNLVESKPLDEDIEMQLYNEKERDILAVENGLKVGNFNELFQNGTFSTKYAQSIANAKVGQIVSPSIISKIGKAHNAEYLIQGTIINLGDGRDEISDDDSVVAFKRSAVVVNADVKIIKAETGEVVWRNIANGSKSNNLFQYGFLKVGTAKINAEMYNSAMEECAENIVKNLLKDLDAGKVFVK